MLRFKKNTQNTIDTSEQSTEKGESIGRIQVAADQLKGIVEQLKHAAEALSVTSSSSQSSVSEFKIHTGRTADDTSQVNEQMQRIQNSAQKILSIVTGVQKDSEQTYQDLILSLKAVDTLEKTMNAILNGHRELISQMNELVEHSKKIDQVFKLIGSISEETNILSLNAAIEAARAGEAGKGFSVVATEIRKLSGETQQAVQDTKETTQLIQKEIKKSTERVNKETIEIDNGSQNLKNILAHLDTFRAKLETIMLGSKESAAAVNEQTTSISAISELINQISAMTQTNQALAETVDQDVANQFENIDQMLSLNKRLIDTSNELQDSIKQDKRATIRIDPEVVERVKRNILQFADDHPLIPLEVTRHKGILSILRDEHPELEAVWSNLSDGSFIFSDPEAALANAGARKWFLEAMKGVPYVSDPYYSAITKRPCVTLSFPIIDENQVIGVFGVDLTIQ